MKARYIPNIISILRIILVGVFTYIFLGYPEKIIPAAGVFILSGISDVVDGALARHYGWISRLGKVLDPIADKLMQCTVLLCLALKGIVPWWIFAFYLVKEGMMGAGALFLFKRRNEVYGSKVFGKAATVLFYVIVVFILIAGEKLSDPAVNILCAIAAAAAVTAFVLYCFSYLKNKKQELPAETEGEIQN